MTLLGIIQIDEMRKEANEDEIKTILKTFPFLLVFVEERRNSIFSYISVDKHMPNFLFYENELKIIGEDEIENTSNNSKSR